MSLKKSHGLKRVILFSHNSNLSGAPISLMQLAIRLPLYGYSPLFLLPKPGPIIDLLKTQKVEYKILKRPGLIFNFIGIVCREKPILVHVNSLVSTWPVLISRIIGKPLIWHVREYLGNKKLYAWLIHLLSTRVVLISHQQYNLFRNKKKAVLILNGIDFSIFENAKPLNILESNHNNIIYVAYIGAIEPRKGIFLLAQAASLLKEKEDIHFIVVGETPDRYKSYNEKVLSFLKKHHIFERFHFLGPRREVPQILAECDILCHPAYIEVFGRVIVEAMVSRIPVVATRVGEIPWIIDNGITGYIVAPGDYQQLAAAIYKLASNKKLRKEMGLRGYYKSKNLYDIDIHTKRIVKVYNDVTFGFE